MNVVHRLWLLAILGWAAIPAAGLASAAAMVLADGEEHAWQCTDTYQPPDFAAYFPDSSAGAIALHDWWAAPEQDRRGDEAIMAVIQDGLRRFDGDRGAILRWLGRTYIGSRTHQHPAAIALVYHASDAAAHEAGVDDVAVPAICLGLVAVEPKPPAILRTLVAVAMESDNPDVLSRIAWGVTSQLEETLPLLEPFRQSSDVSQREKAEVVARILNRELKAYDWADKHKRLQLESQYRAELPQLLDGLHRGGSPARLSVLSKLEEEEGILLLLEDSAIAAFGKCSDDPDPAVRRLAARLIGQRWIRPVQEPLPKAVDLMLDLSRDVDRATQYNAVYYGLIPIPRKEKAVIRQLVEIALEGCEAELSERIARALRGQRAETRALLAEYRDLADVDSTRGVINALSGRSKD